MGKLVLTNKQITGSLTFEDGAYFAAGNYRASEHNELVSVDGGSIQREGVYLGNFYVRFEGDKPKISINDVAFEELENVGVVINNLVTALKEAVVPIN